MLVAASGIRLVLGPPLQVERSQGRDVNAESRKHQLDGTEHEGRERCAGEIADEIDDEDLPESHDADDDASDSREYISRKLEDHQNSRCAQCETRNDSQLLSLPHVQLPNTPDGEDKDQQIRQDIGHDE